MIKKLKSKFQQSTFLKNVLVLMSGSVFAQAVPILLSPFITRVFVPATMGVFGTFSSLTTLIGNAMNLRLDQAVQIPKENEKAENLLKIGVLSAMVLSVVTFVVLVIMSVFGLDYLPEKSWILLIPVFSLLVSLFQLFVRFAIRNKKFKRVSKASMVKALVSSLVSLSVGYLYSDSANTLIFALILAQIAQLTIIGSSFNIGLKIDKTALKKTLKEFHNFPKHFLPASIINILSIQLPIYFLIFFYGEAESGQYFHAHRILTLPITLLSASVGQVFFQKTAEQQQNKQSSEKTILSTFQSLFMVGILPITILLVFGDAIFPFVFGEKWAQSGVFVMCLAPWGLMLFAGSPIINLVSTLRKEKSFLIYNIVLISLRITGLSMGLWYFDNVYVSIGSYGIISFISLTTFVLFLLRSSGIRKFKFIFKLFGLVLLIGLILYVLRILIYAH